MMRQQASGEISGSRPASPIVPWAAVAYRAPDQAPLGATASSRRRSSADRLHTLREESDAAVVQKES